MPLNELTNADWIRIEIAINHYCEHVKPLDEVEFANILKKKSGFVLPLKDCHDCYYACQNVQRYSDHTGEWDQCCYCRGLEIEQMCYVCQLRLTDPEKALAYSEYNK